jgi:hypothetical protein
MQMQHVHRGQFLQRGRGLGSIFSGLFRNVLPMFSSIGRSIFGSPVVKNVGKSLLDSTVRGGLNLAADAIGGEDIKESFKKQLGSARQEVSDAVRREVQPKKLPAPEPGPGRRSRGGVPPPPRKRRKKSIKKKAAPVSVFTERSGDDGDDDDDDDDNIDEDV